MLRLSDGFKQCLKEEEQLASEWKIRMESKMEQILPSRSIILSCLIHERAHSIIRTASCKFSDVSSAALLVRRSLPGPNKPTQKIFLYLTNTCYVILSAFQSPNVCWYRQSSLNWKGGNHLWRDFFLFKKLSPNYN